MSYIFSKEFYFMAAGGDYLEINKANTVHEIHIKNREEIEITGVEDVLSFDAEEIILNTNQGLLLLRGEELHVSRLSLDQEQVDIDGNIVSITYSDRQGSAKKAGRLIGRLFQ